MKYDYRQIENNVRLIDELDELPKDEFEKKNKKGFKLLISFLLINY